MQNTITLVLAIWGALLSTIATVWNIRRDLQDRANIKVKTKVSDQREIHSQIPYIEIELSNIGKRPVTAKEIYMKTDKQVNRANPGNNLPKELREGELYKFTIFTVLNIDNIKFITVKDSRDQIYYSNKYLFLKSR